ncbi:hypothetical protein [Microbacterium terricola]|uniref:Uncharacterized protein n=1 Tax=Microbacterium terricola TaxID=344163 RepID=A0ABM8E0G4_9MICO|nr:hypothetical protein [Microbacterium terricola]UYK40828.1 hypothetical protein OAU46_04040 [Microbacterium terricola]BDV31424.1 hypothetical protein Microterr_20840 [Microbacterium terricola]
MAKPPARDGTFDGEVEVSDGKYWTWTGPATRWIPSGAGVEYKEAPADGALGQ